MNKVFQTIVDPGKGNCMQAVVASLLNEKLENVPNFISHHDWFEVMESYFDEKGYEYDGTLWNKKWNQLLNPCDGVFKEQKYLDELLISSLSKEEGVNGLFFGTVCSPAYFTWSDPKYHAVVIDKHFNIVFDPNPNYYGKIISYPLSEIIDYNGITDVFLFNPKK